MADESGDRKLWKNLRRGRLAAASAPCPDANALAAFLEGRASEDERVALEGHLTDCAACLEALVEARALLAGPPAHVPDRLLEKIGERVFRQPELAVAPRPARARLAWRTLAEMTAVAAALVAACSLGFAMGWRAFSDRSRAAAVLAAEMSFGLGAGLDAGPGHDATNELPSGDLR